MAYNDDITAEELRKLLDYDPETGALTWKARTPDMFETNRQPREAICATWNKRYAGRTAGCVGVNKRVYLKINYKDYLAHRVIWAMVTGEWPEDEIDHNDLNPTNNKWENLRPADKSENGANRRAQSNNTTGYKGVSASRAPGRYNARIQVRGKDMHLGTFTNAEDAYRAYCEAAEKYHGEFARTK